jgi:hypothetical protein
MRNYEIVRIRKRWEVLADGIVKGIFDSEREAARAAKRLFETSPTMGAPYRDPRRRTARIGRRQKTDV